MDDLRPGKENSHRDSRALYCLDCGALLGVFDEAAAQLDEEQSHRLANEHLDGRPRFITARQGEMIDLDARRVDGYTVGDRVRPHDGITDWDPPIRTVEAFRVAGHDGIDVVFREGHSLSIELLTPQ